MTDEVKDLLHYIHYEADAPFETLYEMAMAIVKAVRRGERGENEK